MKILVISDNHGDRDILQAVFDGNAGLVDHFVHCGDSELDPNDPIFDHCAVVRGNNDFDPGFKDDQLLAFGPGTTQYYLTHGDYYQVNSGLLQLSLKTKEMGANVAFYGHTHQLMADLVDGLLYLNPGSISLPRGEYAFIGGTYAILEVTDDTFDVRFYNRSQKEVVELHRSFTR